MTNGAQVTLALGSTVCYFVVTTLLQMWIGVREVVIDTPRVAIVEDNAIYRETLVSYLKQHFDCEIATDSVEGLLSEIAKKTPPDVVLMDIELPGMSGIEGMAHLRRDHPNMDVVMLTVFQDHDRIYDSLCAGASGYLLKHTSLDEIRRSIEVLEHRGAPLTPQIAMKIMHRFFPNRSKKNSSALSEREMEVVQALVDGLSYKMVADRLFISVDTVRHHIRNIYRKLHANSKAEVVAKYMRGEV